MVNILQIAKRYAGNYPLLNEMVKLDPKKYRTVVCYLGGEGDDRNEMDALAGRTVYLGCRSKDLKWYNVPLLWKLKRIIEEENIHVVNCQLHRTTPLGVLAARLSSNRPKVLATLHGLGSANSFKRKLQNWLLYKNVHRIIGVSRAVQKDIVTANWGLDRGKVVAIQNGLNLSGFFPAQDKAEAKRKILPQCGARVWFGTAGRLSAVKNHENLLRAFQQVVQNCPDCALLIAGQGELEKKLKELVQSLNLQERVFFLGYRKDIPDILRALDVFLLPSLREGLPLAMMEAMACGLPVVASRVGGIPELFGDDKMGFLIDPDDIYGLAAAMLEMAQMTGTDLHAMGQNARERVLKDFSSERMIRQYEALYEEAYRSWKKF